MEKNDKAEEQKKTNERKKDKKKRKKKSFLVKLIVIIVLIGVIILLIELNTDFSFLSIFGGEGETEESDADNDNDQQTEIESITLMYEEGEETLYLGGEKLNMDDWRADLKGKLKDLIDDKNLKIVNVDEKNFPKSWFDDIKDLENELGITIQEIKP
jgi:hypothetical protein